MGSNSAKIISFRDLIAWQEGHKLVLAIYNLTKEFPKHELFALANQMQRASVSVTSNIAEGFARRSNKEKIQFYYLALGSVTELQNQLIIAQDIHYLDAPVFNTNTEQSVRVAKLITGLLKIKIPWLNTYY